MPNRKKTIEEHIRDKRRQASLLCYYRRKLAGMQEKIDKCKKELYLTKYGTFIKDGRFGNEKG